MKRLLCILALLTISPAAFGQGGKVVVYDPSYVTDGVPWAVLASKGAAVAVAFSATPTFAYPANALSTDFTITLTGNVTSSTLTGAAAQEEACFFITQDATGGRTFAWPPTILNPPAMNVAANAITASCFESLDGVNWQNTDVTPNTTAGNAVLITPGASQTIQPTNDVTGLAIKQSNTTNTQDIFNVQDKSANKKVQIASTGILNVGTSANIAGPNPWIDCTAPPYNAVYSTDPTAPTVDTGAALRSCFAALPATGGTIHLAPGRYGISTTVTDTQGATVGIDLAGNPGVRVECSSTGGSHQAGTNSHPCSLELISGAAAGSIIMQTGRYLQNTYAGPKLENISFVDNTGTGGAGFAVKDTSEVILNSVYTDGFSYTGLAAPATPTVTATSGGSLGATVTVYVKIAHRTGYGFSLPSAEASATTDGTCPGSGNCTITVTHPTNPSAPAIDYVTYASTTTATEVLQNTCCAGTGYASNFTITASPTTGTIPPEVSNRTQGTGLVLAGTASWGASTGYTNNDVISDYKTGNSNQVAFAVNGLGIASVTFHGGDIFCGGNSTSGSQCSMVGPGGTVNFLGTHWESIHSNVTALELDGVSTQPVRGIEMFGSVFQGITATGTTGINAIQTTNSEFHANMTTLASGIIFGASTRGGNWAFLQTPSGTITTPITDSSANNAYCLGAVCTVNGTAVSGTSFSAYLASPPAIGGTAPAAVSATTLKGTTLNTTTNCSSSASPAVCAAAAAGSVALPTGTNPTLVVNTTVVTANSQINLTVDESLGTKLGVTCNTTLSTLLNPVVTARTGGTSFTFTIGAVIASNPACVSYTIVN